MITKRQKVKFFQAIVVWCNFFTFFCTIGNIHSTAIPGNHPYYNNEGNQPYPGQYYSNDYTGNAGANASPADNINNFFEQQKQHHQYYDQNYYPHDTGTMVPSSGQHMTNAHGSFMSTDNCDSYGFHQQHYEQNQMHNTHHHHHHSLMNNQVQMHPNGVASGNSTPIINAQNAQHYFGNFEMPPGATLGTGHFDNSNSSSDFNFLSNIANDFSQAPEYYQLS